MTITQSYTRVVATAAGAVVALGLMFGTIAAPVQASALTQTQIQAIISLLQSFGADQSTINNVQASLNGQATTGTTGGTTTGGSCTASYTRNLTVGSTGSDVMALQKLLNSNSSTMVAATGAGSPGNETSYFGPATKSAVVKFQTQNGISPTSGYVGPLTRAKLNAMCTGGTTTGGTTTGGTTTSGTGLTVSAAAQPANGLAPANASRVPFTSFTVTAGNDGDVTLNGVTVERQGVASDASFSGVELIDQSTGVQIGTSHTLNSNHQATIGDTIVIPRGTSKTFTVAANRGAAGSHAGELATFAVVAVNSSATVTGSLPIVGATQTINESLVIGTVSTSTSAFDPGADQTKNLGDTGVRFSGVRFTASSAEDLRLYSIRWRQVGSVSSSDLANVVTIINGTSYPTTVDSTGKYYTSTFPGGVLIPKGNSVDAYIQGDIVGSNAASRTVDFDIDKVTDVYFVGQLYGYGVAPSGTYTPWYNGHVVTVNAGTATTISKATEVPAQNIAVNVPNQVLGGFVADFKGEPVSVTTLTMTIATSSGITSPITSISIVDENGHVVAGPVDESASGTTGQTITFPDTVTFNTGRHVYTVTGKIPSGAANNSTVIVSTNPSAWSGVTGQTSGNTITISQGNFAMNTMTVKAGALAVAVSATPAAQSVVAGAQGFTLANIQLDATQSGEDVRLSTVPVTFNLSTNAHEANPGNLSSCQMFDGTSALNGGGNVVNPASVATSTTAQPTASFVFDNPLTVAKGTVKTIALKCNIAGTSDANSTFQAGMSTSQITGLAVTGVSSGATITPTGSQGVGQVMTVASTGSVVASTDSSSPSYAVAAANQTGVTLGVYKFRATNEDVNLNRIGLTLTNATASSSAQDLTQVSLYQGSKLIGTAAFVGSNTHATATLATPITLTRDTDVAITVKGDIANMGTSQPATAGHLIQVDVDTNGTNTEGTGAQSGSTVDATGSTAVSGVRIFKSFPTLAKDSVPTNTLNNGTQALLRFKVTANAAGDVGIGKVTLQISTTTATVTGVNVYAYTDSAYSVPVSGLRSDGALMATDDASVPTSADIDVLASTPVQVPAGQTRYFEVRGTVAGAATGASVQTQLQGDAAYPSFASTFLGTVSTIDSDTNDDFIWSPNTTGTAATTDTDWTNGFGLLGLPASNMGAEVLSK